MNTYSSEGKGILVHLHGFRVHASKAESSGVTPAEGERQWLEQVEENAAGEVQVS